jgi:hypothetical protein
MLIFHERIAGTKKSRLQKRDFLYRRRKNTLLGHQVYGQCHVVINELIFQFGKN